MHDDQDLPDPFLDELLLDTGGLSRCETHGELCDTGHGIEDAFDLARPLLLGRDPRLRHIRSLEALRVEFERCVRTRGMDCHVCADEVHAQRDR